MTVQSITPLKETEFLSSLSPELQKPCDAYMQQVLSKETWYAQQMLLRILDPTILYTLLSYTKYNTTQNSK